MKLHCRNRCNHPAAAAAAAAAAATTTTTAAATTTTVLNFEITQAVPATVPATPMQLVKKNHLMERGAQFVKYQAVQWVVPAKCFN